MYKHIHNVQQVSTYFFNETPLQAGLEGSESTGRSLKATFRGHELKGITAKLPDNYMGNSQ
jgi:hypothetical protein